MIRHRQPIRTNRSWLGAAGGLCASVLLPHAALAQTFECSFHEECGASSMFGTDGGCQEPGPDTSIVVFVDQDRGYIRIPGEDTYWGTVFRPNMAEISPAVRDLYEGVVAVTAANDGAGIHSVRISAQGNALYSFLTLFDITRVAYGACQQRGG